MRQQQGLLRSRRDSMIGGVCGGIARWLGWDSANVRIAYVLISIFSAAFPGTIVYLILWFLMPQADDLRRPGTGVEPGPLSGSS